MTHRLPKALPASLPELLRYPVTQPLPFVIHRQTGRMSLDPLLASLLNLPHHDVEDGGVSLVEHFLDPSDRRLCLQSFRDLLDGRMPTCRHIGRMKVFGETFWVRVDLKALSTHQSSRRIQGSVLFFNFHRILSELVRRLDCSDRDRSTLLGLANVRTDCRTAVVDFSALPCEPDEFCARLKENRPCCVFAAPLYDGSVVVSFSCEPEGFYSNLKRLTSLDAINASRSFVSELDPDVDKAVEIRCDFLKRLSDHIPVNSGLTLAEVVSICRAIRHDFQGLELHFQPQVGNGGFVGGEFLARLTGDSDPGLGPEAFVSYLEKTELIRPFGRWVAETAIESTRELSGDVRPGFTVSFNLSACQANDAGFVPFVKHSLVRCRLPAHHLMVELTETAQPINVPTLSRQIEALRALGVQTAIDDFGTGYNSIEVLFLMPFDMVKFSRRFVAKAIDDPMRRRFFMKLIDACHALGVDVCAEGVENEDMHRTLRDLSVDIFQGYCFAKPQPLNDAVLAVKQCAALNPESSQ